MNKRHRLNRTLDFQRVFRSGVRSYIKGLLVLLVLNVANTDSKLGIVVSSKMGNAVVRNAFKRRVRICFARLLRHFHCTFELVVVARTPSAVLLPLKSIEQVLNEVLKNQKLFCGR